jgi:hypothetical protein
MRQRLKVIPRIRLQGLHVAAYISSDSRMGISVHGGQAKILTLFFNNIVALTLETSEAFYRK